MQKQYTWLCKKSNTSLVQFFGRSQIKARFVWWNKKDVFHFFQNGNRLNIGPAFEEFRCKISFFMLLLCLLNFWLMNQSKSYGFIYTKSFKQSVNNQSFWAKEVVVAQVVEGWHSVWAGRVKILGWTLTFFQFRIAVNLFSLGVGLFLLAYNRMVHTLPSSFLLPVSYHHLPLWKIINCKLTM